MLQRLAPTLIKGLFKVFMITKAVGRCVVLVSFQVDVKLCRASTLLANT